MSSDSENDNSTLPVDENNDPIPLEVTVEDDPILLGNEVEDPHELFAVPEDQQLDEDEKQDFVPEDLSDLETEFGAPPPREV